jgi:hypothetical protein
VEVDMGGEEDVVVVVVTETIMVVVEEEDTEMITEVVEVTKEITEEVEVVIDITTTTGGKVKDICNHLVLGCTIQSCTVEMFCSRSLYRDSADEEEF